MKIAKQRGNIPCGDVRQGYWRRRLYTQQLPLAKPRAAFYAHHPEARAEFHAIAASVYRQPGRGFCLLLGGSESRDEYVLQFAASVWITVAVDRIASSVHLSAGEPLAKVNLSHLFYCVVALVHSLGLDRNNTIRLTTSFGLGSLHRTQTATVDATAKSNTLGRLGFALHDLIYAKAPGENT